VLYFLLSCPPAGVAFGQADRHPEGLPGEAVQEFPRWGRRTVVATGVWVTFPGYCRWRSHERRALAT